MQKRPMNSKRTDTFDDRTAIAFVRAVHVSRFEVVAFLRSSFTNGNGALALISGGNVLRSSLAHSSDAGSACEPLSQAGLSVIADRCPSQRFNIFGRRVDKISGLL